MIVEGEGIDSLLTPPNFMRVAEQHAQWICDTLRLPTFRDQLIAAGIAETHISDMRWRAESFLASANFCANITGRSHATTT
jgi:hypothetical protein